MNSFLQVTVLAILQGITEFLPVSSSGHLAVVRHLRWMEGIGGGIDIFLHAGTLGAVFVFYASVIRRIISGREWAYLGKIALSAVPAGVVGLLLHGECAFPPVVTCVAYFFTGCVLLLTAFLRDGDGKITFGKAFLTGMAQTLALLPGVSRSGMTISAGRLLGVSPARCAEFSFLMSAPPIAGATLLELLKGPAEVGVSVPILVYGVVLSAVTGYFSLRFLVKLLNGGRFWMFGPYCLALGVYIALNL